MKICDHFISSKIVLSKLSWYGISAYVSGQRILKCPHNSWLKSTILFAVQKMFGNCFHRNSQAEEWLKWKPDVVTVCLDTGLLHHFHFNLWRLYGWDILWILICTRVSTDWHISHVFMVHTESSIFVSDVLTLYAHWLILTLKVITLYIWLPKTEFMPMCFCLNFFICGCE